MAADNNEQQNAATWRTTIVGVLMLGFVLARIHANRGSLFDGETMTLFAAACGLILGTDRLLGHA